jgi:type II secretory ATPase GspE/PulE/Tfp pilus assembly ATPase PilB-like protein
MSNQTKLASKKDMSDSGKQVDDLISVLVSQGAIDQNQADEIRSKAQDSGQDFFDYLQENKIVEESELLKAASLLFNLNRISIGSRSISNELLSLIPEEQARKFKIIPYELKGNQLKVALNNPYDLPEIDRKIFSKIKDDYRYQFYLAKLNDIKSSLNQYNNLKEKKESKKIEVEKNEKKDDPINGNGQEIKNQLLQVLIRQDIIDSVKARRILEKAENSNLEVEAVLRDEGIDDAKIQKAKAQISGLEFVKLADMNIPEEVLNRIPKEIAEKYQIVAYDEIGERVLKVASVDSKSKVLKDIIQFAQTKKGIDIRLSLTTRADIDKVLESYQNSEEEQETLQADDKKVSSFDDDSTEEQDEAEPTSDKTKEPKSLEAEESSHEKLKGRISSLIKRKVRSKDELDQIISKGSVPRIVAGVVNFALSQRASDVHIQPTDNGSLLRYRIDGVLSNITEIPKELHPAIISRIKILSRLRIDEKRKPQDGRFEVKYDNREIDLRVSTMPTTNDEKVVLRLLDKSRKEFDLEELGLKGSNFTKLVKNIKKPYGMIVATGPTGSGKSTTLYAAISKINQPKINIITLEDPIEYELKGVSQSQAKPEIGYSFANGLRSVLRQDPDVIMVGEIRDKETAEMAIHAALTGHLLFSTLHTNDAAGAIPRLIDMGIEPFLISSAANAFLAQRLVRKICPNCKEKDPKFDERAKKKIKKVLSNLSKSERRAVPDEKDWQIYRGKGCDKCYQGYKGRVGIFEVLEVDQKIRSMIHEDVSISDIRDKAIEDGMVTMEQDGIIKALKGVTTLEEIFRVTGVVEEQF